LVLQVVLEALQALLVGFVGGLPGDAPRVEAGADGLAHFVAGQAGAHGPEEEFVIVERGHNITVGG
jgi:hypothetical protein